MNLQRVIFSIILIGAIPNTLAAKSFLQGTVSFLNSGSRPVVGLKISAFGAKDFYTTESGMFILEFPDKQPGDKIKIIIGSADQEGTPLELVNDKVLAQQRIPSRPDDDIIEIIVCKVGQRNEAALRYNGLFVKTINESTEKRLNEIDKKLGASKIDAETIISLQKEKDKLVIERDSALAKAEEQALFIASINLDKANQLVKDAVIKVDSLQDIPGAIAILDNEALLKAYEQANGKIKNAKTEVDEVIEGFKLKIKLLALRSQNADINDCCLKLEKICKEQNYDLESAYHCFDWATIYMFNEKKIKIPNKDMHFLDFEITKIINSIIPKIENEGINTVAVSDFASLSNEKFPELEKYLFEEFYYQFNIAKKLFYVLDRDRLTGLSNREIELAFNNSNNKEKMKGIDGILLLSFDSRETEITIFVNVIMVKTGETVAFVMGHITKTATIDKIIGESKDNTAAPFYSDKDYDGISDEHDNCPNEYGSRFSNGCPDSDDDGTPDKNDMCKFVYGEKRFNGCPDSDKDDVPDNLDKCPTIRGLPINQGCPEPATNSLAANARLRLLTERHPDTTLVRTALSDFPFDAKNITSKEEGRLVLKWLGVQEPINSIDYQDHAQVWGKWPLGYEVRVWTKTYIKDGPNCYGIRFQTETLINYISTNQTYLPLCKRKK